jgi:hypothetical protein
MRVAQAVALARGEATMDLLYSMLGLSMDDLAARCRELERRQLVRGGWFTQGALAALVLEGTPAPVRADLTRRMTTWKALRRYGGLW